MLGTLIGVRFEAADCASALRRLLGSFHCPPTDDVAYRYSLTSSRLYRDDVLIGATMSAPALVDLLLGDLNRVAIEHFQGFAAHAGVVARGEVALAFPAPSGTGKSTLTAACLGAGFQYVSDEALCVDFATDAVIPYPKPLKLAGHAAGLVGLALPGQGEVDCALAPEDLGASPATGPLRLGHVVSLLRRRGPPILRSLDRSATVATLLTMSFNHYRNPLSSFTLVSRLAADTRAWRLEYDEPSPAATRLGRLLDEDGITN
jgi:hypothetical protein